MPKFLIITTDNNGERTESVVELDKYNLDKAKEMAASGECLNKFVIDGQGVFLNDGMVITDKAYDHWLNKRSGHVYENN